MATTRHRCAVHALRAELLGDTGARVLRRTGLACCGMHALLEQWVLGSIGAGSTWSRPCRLRARGLDHLDPQLATPVPCILWECMISSCSPEAPSRCCNACSTCMSSQTPTPPHHFSTCRLPPAGPRLAASQPLPARIRPLRPHRSSHCDLQYPLYQTLLRGRHPGPFARCASAARLQQERARGRGARGPPGHC